MIKITAPFWFLLCALIPAWLYCPSIKAEPRSETKPVLEVAVGWSKPPYIIARNNSGYELDMVREIFSIMGYRFKPVYVPYGRTVSMLQRKQVDAALTIGKQTQDSNLVLSDHYIEYQNVAISLHCRGIKINRARDLQHYAFSAYQTASQNLGQEYALAAKQAPLYVELPDQEKQVAMLLNGNVSVVVMDINIFNHIRAILERDIEPTRVSIHNIFPANEYRMGFANTQLRDKFNQALDVHRAYGAQQVLAKKYRMFSHNQLMQNPAPPEAVN